MNAAKSKHPDVVIIGAGVIGLTCAWRLAEEGASVTLLERESCGSGASGASLGALMPAPATKHAPFQVLQRESLASYPQFCEQLREITGIDVGFERCGLLEIIHNEQRRRQAQAEARVAAEQWCWKGPEPVMEVLDRQEAARLEPLVNHTEFGARLCRMTAQVDARRLLEALCRACDRSGVRVREGVKVSSILLDAGRARGVRCGDEIVNAGAVLAAAGAWTSQLSPALEKAAPIRPVKGQALLLKVDRPLFGHVIKQGPRYLLPRGDRTVLLGSTTEPEAGFNQRTTAAGMAGLTAGAVLLVSALAEAAVMETWAGLRPESDDCRPYIGPVQGIAGLLVAAGHFKTGIALAPVTGRIMTDLIMDRSPPYDIAPFATRSI